MEKIYDMLIVGGGPAGYTAALYAARAGLKALVLERQGAGGQMALTHWIDNYPGLPEGVEGFTLGENMRRGAERFGVETVAEEVLKLDLRSDPKAAVTGSGAYYGRTLVLATGADPRPLGVPGEESWKGRGLSYCAHCDGMFYRGKTALVVGGGNSAMGDAGLLARVAGRVVLVHRRNSLRAEKAAVEALGRAGNVEFIWNSVVAEILGGEKITGARLYNRLTGEETTVPCDGIFVSIGRAPATALVQGQLELDEGGYVLAGEETVTNIPGVYAAGDVRTKSLRQIVTATADGAAAVHMAEAYLRPSP